MNLNQPWPLLGGISPQQFMRRYWQKKPLLIRQAWPQAQPPLTRAALFDLASDPDVESRLVQGQGDAWQLKRGPFTRRQLPALSRSHWTLLVQGVDLHDDRAHAMLQRFRFVPDARLDDLMISYASDGGGVGPHLDSYDVFLLQVQGRRRWRIGPVIDPQFLDGLPVRILKDFKPDEVFDLDPGDMLYLPPRWGHDGIALGECMTCSIGFKAPLRHELAADLMARLADDLVESPAIYRDKSLQPTLAPGRIPPDLQAYATAAVQREVARAGALPRLLGEMLTEPKSTVWFEGGAAPRGDRGVVLDRRSRMMYDDEHVYLNGESFRAGGTDARWMAQLADQRQLQAADVRRLSRQAKALLLEWVRSGWLLESTPGGTGEVT